MKYLRAEYGRDVADELLGESIREGLRVISITLENNNHTVPSTL